MKNNRRDLLLLLSALLIWLFADARAVRAAAARGLALCARSVVPALFPFLAVSSALISLGFGEWAAALLSPLMALYRLPGSAGSAVVLGLLGGYPVGAGAAAELYRKGALTRDEAERLLPFCNNASPAFLISVLGQGVFGSTRTGLALFLVHLLSALLAGLVFRGRERRAAPPEYHPAAPFLPALVASVGNAGLAMVRLCAFVVFFTVLADPLRALGGRLAVIGTGCLELFSLTALLPPDRFGLIAASVFTAWGGAGVLCQTAAVLDGSGLSLRRCAAGKAVQAVIAGLLAAAIPLR